MTSFLHVGLLVSFLLVLPAPLAQATAPNLLSNGGFSAGLAGWTTWGAAGPCAWSVTPLTPQLHLVDASTAHSCGVYQTVPVKTGAVYAGRATANVVSGVVQLYVRWVDPFGNDVGTFPVATSVGVGVQPLVAAGVAPPGASHARFWFYVPTSHVGDAYLDDATLTEVG